MDIFQDIEARATMPTPDGSIPGLSEDQTLYGYTPTLWVCALFIALFGLSTLIHVLQAAKVSYGTRFANFTTLFSYIFTVSTLVVVSYHCCGRNLRSPRVEWQTLE